MIWWLRYEKISFLSLLSALCFSSYSCSFSQSAIHIDHSQIEKQLNSASPGGYGYVAARLLGVNLASVHPTELAVAATELAHIWKGNAQLTQIACRASSTGVLNLEALPDTELHYYFTSPTGTGTGDATLANVGGQAIMRISTYDSGVSNDTNVPLPIDHLVDLSVAMQKAVPDIGGADRPDIMCRYKVFPAKNGQPKHLAWQLQNWNTQKERFVDATTSGTLTSHATGMSAWQRLLAEKTVMPGISIRIWTIRQRPSPLPLIRAARQSELRMKTIAMLQIPSNIRSPIPLFIW